MFICVHLWMILLFSGCGAPPADLKALAPAETLVYLETENLGTALGALTESNAFGQAAKEKPDFSALENMRLAVAVTGFETSENQVTAENSVLNFKPRFVAIADTRAWNWQTVSFTEKTLGGFVNETYGGEVELEIIPKNDGKSFVWTATDGRKIFAFVAGSVIFFGNDETALEKCLAVRRGEADSFAKNGKTFNFSENTLAAGYVSGEGVAQIAGIVGVLTAIEATDEEDGRSFIARVLPEILRGTIREISWTAAKTEQGIEDRYEVSLVTETASVVRETFQPAPPKASDSAEFLPADVFGATSYKLQNPQLAWRSLVLVAAKQTDEPSGRILTEFAGGLLENYGVTDAETFLSAVDPEILTAQFDAEGENAAAVAIVKDAEKVKKSLGEINFKKAAEKNGSAEIRKTEDGALAAAFVENKLILGDAESVLKCLAAKASGQNFTKASLFKKFSESRAAVATLGKDSGEKTIEVLAEKKAENLALTTNFLTETSFHEKGVERRTVSPFGLLGTIIEQFAK